MIRGRAPRPPPFFRTARFYCARFSNSIAFFEQEETNPMWGADHVVIGMDCPYDMGCYKPVDFVNRTKSLY